MVGIMKERKAYIVLVALCIFLCGGVLTISLISQDRSEKRLCEVLVVEKLYPPPKPVSPEADRSAERAWQFHIRRLDLYKDLGC